jgi:hypothetical protein
MVVDGAPWAEGGLVPKELTLEHYKGTKQLGQ